MIKSIITDLSKVLLFPLDESYTGKLNDLHETKLKTDDYDFWKIFKMNEELLHFYRKLSRKVDIYIFTTRYIQEYPPLKQKLDSTFSKVFSSDQLGIEKADSKSYTKLAQMIHKEPDQILFVDDRPLNIEAAKKAGLITYQYDSNGNFFDYLIESRLIQSE